MIFPIVLSGGAGTRLWPYSRKKHPKQFQSLGSDQSLLQDTVRRTTGDSMFAPPMIICNEEHRFLVAEQLRAVDIVARSIVLEPVPRNTAPAVAVAALIVARDDPDGILLIMPSDHAISDREGFLETVRRGNSAAVAGSLVTFGIKPTRADSGFGYISAGAATEYSENCFEVGKFVEKPTIEKAEEYVQSGKYYWNSGIFMFSASTYIEELRRFDPDIVENCQAAIERGQDDLDFFRLDEDSFTAAKSISIDYAVIENTDRAVVVPAEYAWCDVGSWNSLWEYLDKDEDGNSFVGNIVSQGARNSLAWSNNRMVALLDVDDLVVATTDDVVLVCARNSSQKIKSVVEKLAAEERLEIEAHTTVYRPWGWYRLVDQGDGFLVKRINVKPGATLSLQMHNKRAEHWVVVQGTAKVTCGDEITTLEANQSTYIPIGTRHRLENPGDEALEIIEVQSGDYLGEDDIVRFEDVYGRA
jgi:mannose-1-phosphate guanylyltransferase/mannose-1-phosphate guanylyltransferase/mannose-6-phosphate isomerase